MEYAIYVLVFVAGAAGGSVFGVLFGRSNVGTVEKVIANAKAEIKRNEARAAELKAKLAEQGIKI